MKKKVLRIFELGSTEIRTRVFGFKVQGANHYTLEPIESSACVLFNFSRQAFYLF